MTDQEMIFTALAISVTLAAIVLVVVNTWALAWNKGLVSAPEETKKPLPFEVPKVEPVTSWPEAVQRSLLELVAFTANRPTPMINFELKDLTHEQLRLGSYRITVEKID